VIPVAKGLGKRVVVHLHGYAPVSYTAVVLAPYEEHKHRISRDDIALECAKSLAHCAGAATLWWLPRLARMWLSQADRIVCVSRRHAEIIANLAPELRDRIEVVYNPPPPDLVAAQPRKELDNSPTFLYAGGDSYVKGFHLVVRVLKELDRRNIRATLILTNYYSTSALSVIQRVNARLTAVRVRILPGRVERRSLIGLYRVAWALLFPSISEEPLPYAVVEAALLATMPAATRVGGVYELLKETAAENFTYRPGDIAGIVVAIEAVLELGERLRDEVLRKLERARIAERIQRALYGD